MKFLLTTIILFAASLIIECQTYNLNLEKSSIRWTGKAAFSTYKLSGSLKARIGHLTLSEEWKVTAGEVIVDMTSLNAEIKDLKKHLKSEDFFHVKEYDEASFLLGQYKEEGMCYEGVLTIKGVARPYTAQLKLTEIGATINLSGVLHIDRTTYGITYNSPTYFEKLKEQAIADEFDVELDLVFEKL